MSGAPLASEPTTASARPGRTEAVIRNSGLLAVSLLITTVGGAAASVMLAHALPVEELGRYGLWFRVYAWLTALATFALPPVLIRFVAELRGAGETGTARHLLRVALRFQAVMLALSLILLAVYTVFGGDGFAPGLPLAAALVAFGISQVTESFLRGGQTFAPLTMAALFSTVVRLAGIGWLLIAGGGALAALRVLAIANIASVAVTLLACRERTTRGDGAGEIGDALKRRLLDYGAGMGVAGFLSMPVWNYIEVFFIDRMMTDRTRAVQELAVYTTAVALAVLPIRVTKVLSGALLPAYAEMVGSGDTAALRRAFHSATILSFAVGGFIAIAGIALARPAVVLLLPVDLHAVAMPLRLLLIPVLLLSLGHAATALLPPLDGHRYLIGSLLVLVPINIALDLLLIPGAGAIGAATVNAIVQSLATAAAIHFVASRRAMGLPVRRLVRLTVALVLAGVTMALVAQFDAGRGLAVLILMVALLLGLVVMTFACRMMVVLTTREKAILEVAASRLPAGARFPALRMVRFL